MKIIKANYNEPISDKFIGIAEFPDGTKIWLKEGNFHREDGPAIESSDGTKQWYKEGKWHREDGPAIEFADGYKEWRKEGKRHRLNGPAIQSLKGTKEWWIENNLYTPKSLLKLIESSLYLGKEKGQYNLEWLKFLTEEGIEEFPIVPEMKEDRDFKEVFEELEKIENE
jgi:hypothetical protein